MFGQRLRLARKQAGLSMRELADAMSPRVSARAIGRYEAGGMPPSSAVLVGFGKALDVSLDFLASAQVEELDAVELRRRSGIPVRERARVEAVVTDGLERYLAIEHILDIETGVDRPGKRRSDGVASESGIDERADELRRAWGLGLDPIPDMCGLLERKGVKVLETDLPVNVNGLSCHALRGGETVAEAIVVSGRIDVERKRFALARELARGIVRSAGNPARGMERAMDRFAGAFLVPGRCLRENVGDDRRMIARDEIVRLKHLFAVPAEVLLMRLGQAGILPRGFVKHAFATFARPWRISEPYPIRPGHGFTAFEKPRRFKRLVARALGERLISPVRAAGLLDRPLESVERLIAGPATDRPASPSTMPPA